MRKFLMMVFDTNDKRVQLHDLLIVIAFIALLFLQWMAVVNGNDFVASSYGEAVGMILGGGGLAAIGQSVLNRTNKNDDQ